MKEGTPDNMRLRIFFFSLAPFYGGVCTLFLQRLRLRMCILRPSMSASCVYFCRVYNFSNGYICGCVYFVPLWRRGVYIFAVCILFF